MPQSAEREDDQSSFHLIPWIIQECGATVPCRSTCSFCRSVLQLQQTFKTSQISSMWNRILKECNVVMDANRADPLFCPFAEAVNRKARYSIINMDHFCPLCDLRQYPDQSMPMSRMVLKSEGDYRAIDLHKFVYGRPRGICGRHAKPRLQYIALGDVPQISVIQVRTNQYTSTSTLSRFAALQFTRIESDGISSYSFKYNLKSTFLSRTLFFKDFSSSEALDLLQPTVIHKEECKKYSYFLVKIHNGARTERSCPMHVELQQLPRRDNLSQLFLSSLQGIESTSNQDGETLGSLENGTSLVVSPEPFSNSEGTSANNQSGRNIQSSQSRSRDHESSSNSEGTSANNQSGRNIQSSQSRSREIESSSNSEGTSANNQSGRNIQSSQSRSRDNRNSVLGTVSLEQRQVTGSTGNVRTDQVEIPASLSWFPERDLCLGRIPFLFQSWEYFQSLDIQTENEQDNSWSMVDIEERFRTDKSLLFTAQSAEGPQELNFGSAYAELEDLDHLSVQGDVDSIDILTHPWAINTFKGKIYMIYTSFHHSYVETSKYLKTANNLVSASVNLVNGSRMYPGAYFKNILPELERNPNDKFPLAIRIFEMNSELSVEPLIVRAIFPTEVVRILTDGDSSLLKLFHKRLHSPEGDEENSDIKRILQHCGEDSAINRDQYATYFLWYLTKELFIFIASIVTNSMKFNIEVSRSPCCAIPLSTNSAIHDRVNGPCSGLNQGVSMNHEEYLLTCHLCIRFLICLEECAEVPESYRVITSSLPDNGALPICPHEVLGNIKGSVDGLRQILEKTRVDDDMCGFFREKIWCEQTIGDLVCLKFDESRKNEQALPTSQSNKEALERGHLCLQDFLLISPALFRCTQHGLKREFQDLMQAEEIGRIINEAFNCQFVVDGIVDVALTFHSSSKAKCSVLLPFDLIKQNQVLFPNVYPSRRPQDEFCLFVSHGYPKCCSVSSVNGKFGMPDSVSDPRGVRRVKYYNTQRHAEATRGRSMMQASGATLCASLREPTNIFRQWQAFKGPKITANQAANAERRRMSLWYSLIHEMDERNRFNRKNNSNMGLRVEMTSAYSAVNTCLIQAGHLVEFSKRQSSIGTTDSSAIHVPSQDQRPWWTQIGTSAEGTSSRRHLHHPVILFKSDLFSTFCHSVEKRLMLSSFALYISIKNNMSGSVHRETDFARSSSLVVQLKPLLEHMPRLMSTTLALLVTRSLLEASGIFSTGAPCKITNNSLSLPPFEMSALGLDVTMYTYGYPHIHLPRLLSLHESFMDSAHSLSESSDLARELNMMSNPLAAISEWEAARKIPRRLHFRMRRVKHGFEAHVFGDLADTNVLKAQSLSLSETRHEKEDRRQNRITASLSRFIQTSSEEDTLRSVRSVATLLTVFLVSDVCNALVLQYQFRQADEDESFSRRLHAFNQKRIGAITSSTIRDLSGRTQEEWSWPERYQIADANLSLPNGHFKALKALVSVFETDTSGLSTLDTQPHVKCFNSHVNDEGYMNMQLFINLLWKMAECRPALGVANPYERRGNTVCKPKYHPWDVVDGLRIAEGLFRLQKNSAESLHNRHNPHTIFLSKLPEFLQEALASAGFMVLSPRLHEQPISSKTRNEPWGPLKCFTALIPTTNVVSPLRQFNDTKVSTAVYFTDGTANIIGRAAPASNEYSTIPQRLTRIKGIIYNALNHHKKISEKSKKAEDFTDATSRRIALKMLEAEWINESKKVWGTLLQSDLFDMVLENSLRRLMKNNAVQECNSRVVSNSLDYAKRIIEFLASQRVLYGDEGLAIRPGDTAGNEHVMLPAWKFNSDIWSQQTTFGKTLFSKPWHGYPDSGKTRHGTTTRDIRTRISSRILAESRLVFKLLPRDAKQSRQIPLRVAGSYRVDKIYQRLREEDEDKALNSNCMWRLSPDVLVLRTLLRWIKAQSPGTS